MLNDMTLTSFPMNLKWISMSTVGRFASVSIFACSIIKWRYIRSYFNTLQTICKIKPFVFSFLFLMKKIHLTKMWTQTAVHASVVNSTSADKGKKMEIEQECLVLNKINGNQRKVFKWNKLSKSKTNQLRKAFPWGILELTHRIDT